MPLRAPFGVKNPTAVEIPTAQCVRYDSPADWPTEFDERGASPALQMDVIDSLPGSVAVLDQAGTIIAVNKSWKQFATSQGLQAPNTGLGSNYLSICDQVKDEDSLAGSRAAAGIREVLAGVTPRFCMEYVLELPSADAWFLMMVSPVGEGSLAGATVMHLDITERKHEEGNLWRFAATMDSLADGVLMIDRASMAVTYVNDAACQLHGMSREQVLKRSPWENVGLGRADLERKYDRIVAQGGIGDVDEILWSRPDGSEIWIEVRRHAHCLDGAVCIVVLLRDISARKHYESRIRYLNRVHAILSGINTLIVRARTREELFCEACRIPVDKGGFPISWIGAIDRLTNKLIPVASAGMSSVYFDGLVEELQHGSPDALARSYVMRTIADRQIHVCHDSRNDKHVLVGEHHEVHGIRSFAILPLVVADEVVGVFGLYAGEPDFFHAEELALLSELAGDVSFAIDHIEKQQRLDYLAYYDSLTGLANRRLFGERLGQFVRTAEINGEQFAVCIADIERFRNFNDSLGRQAGDGLLAQVAEWLLTHSGDQMRVGRLDSDHFALILCDVQSESSAIRAVESLINSFAAQSFSSGGTEYRMAMKVGVAMYPQDGIEAAQLNKNAGAALTKAKAGREPYLFYAQRMTETVAGRLGMENQLRQALEREEFVLHYQPKISLSTGQMIGAEALLRWDDPRTGLVAPARFIPLLEETGLIFEVGRWVLGKAIEDHATWRRAGYPPVRIAVNVSPLQLRHSGFVADIQRKVGADECVASGLELEITETLIMEDVKRSIAALQAIRETGVTIAIDDFGTGYSSLSQLSKLPVDTIKIDRSFILEMIAGTSGMSLVATIINLAHSFKLKAVAEGVETTEQAGLLHRLACDEAQGYLYSKPVPADVFREKFLQGGH